MAKNSNQTVLTIGLELEMIVQNFSPNMDECINHYIAQYLREGLSVSFFNPLNSSSSFYQAPITHVGAAKPMLIAPSSPCAIPVVDWIGDHPNLRHFFVTSKPDCLSGIPEEQKPFTAGIEVRTPVLRVGSWQFAVKSVLSTLSAVPDIAIQFTQHCGLHVHIGRRGGFDLLHIKGLAKAVVIFEEDIENAWHPEHRCGGGIGKKIYANSNRKASVSLKTLKTTMEMVRLIEQQDSISGVRGVICDEDVGNRDFKYNFQSLVELGSVEFRQAQGTLNEEWVVGWVEMLIVFVKAAEVVSETLFEKFAMAADAGENQLGDFLAWGMDNKEGDGGEDNGYGGDRVNGEEDGNLGGEEEEGWGKWLQLVANLNLQLGGGGVV